MDGEFSKHTHSVLTVVAPLPVVMCAMDGEFSKHPQCANSGGTLTCGDVCHGRGV